MDPQNPIQIPDLDQCSSASLEDHLINLEANIAVLRTAQAELLSELDARQIVRLDGARNVIDWVAGRLDVSHNTATKLVDITRTIHTGPTPATSFDRQVATTRLARSGADTDTLERAKGLDIGGVHRMTVRHHHYDRTTETIDFHGRRLVMQPNLDESEYRIHGNIAGYEGRVVAKTLTQEADAYPRLPDGTREPLRARMADALFQVCLDHNDGQDSETGSATGGPMVTVFVDARQAAPSNGQQGVWIANGPRVGPAVLEQVLCEGTVEVTALTEDGTPLAIGTAATAIPPRLRRHIAHRDNDTCTIEGCQSRYRTQPHHIKPRSHDGTNHPDNLTLLCWYHHHIVIHRHGYQLAPDSPPQRRRFLRRGPISPRAG